MNCPNCGETVHKEELSCSNCGKLLRIKCPRCAAISTKAVCPKCQLELIVKCQKCGKKNPVTLKSCKKCDNQLLQDERFKDYKLQQFAILCLEFRNLSLIKEKLGDSFNSFWT